MTGNTIYIVFFTHVKDGQTSYDHTEAWLNEKPEITSQADIISMEQAISAKGYINPKICNFVPLRKHE